MFARGLSVPHIRVIADHADAVLMRPLDHLAQEVQVAQAGVFVADFSIVVKITELALGEDNRYIDAGTNKLRDQAIRVKACGDST